MKTTFLNNALRFCLCVAVILPVYASSESDSDSSPLCQSINSRELTFSLEEDVDDNVIFVADPEDNQPVPSTEKTDRSKLTKSLEKRNRGKGADQIQKRETGSDDDNEEGWEKTLFSVTPGMSDLQTAARKLSLRESPSQLANKLPLNRPTSPSIPIEKPKKNGEIF